MRQTTQTDQTDFGVRRGDNIAARNRHPAPERPAQRELVVLTAHSLPQAVIDRGDRYQAEFEACAAKVQTGLGREVVLAYQSQGEGGGAWLGPTLLQTMQKARRDGYERVVVSPIGFLSEHIETLYDLDVEARAHAEALDLTLVRVPTVGEHPALITAMADTAKAAMAGAEPAPRQI